MASDAMVPQGSETRTEGQELSTPAFAPVGPLSSLRYSGFRLLWVAGLFSGGGQLMQRVVNSWLVYVLTDSPFQLGLIGAFQALPLVLFSLAGGALADTLDRRRLLLVTQGVRALFGLMLLLLSVSGNLEVWHLYAMTFMSTAASVFDGPARQALLPTLVPQSHVTNAIVLNSITLQLNRIIGPGLAGGILALAGPSTAYAANLALFGMAWVVLLALRTPAMTRQRKRSEMLAMMAEGLRFVTKTNVILALLMLDAFATFFGAYEILMPVFARDVLGVGPAGLGLLLAAPAAGALLGSAGVMLFGDVQRKGTVVLAAVFFYALALIGFGLSPWFLLSLAFAGALGALDAVAMTLRNAVILLVTPDDLRGRVESMRMMFVMGAPALGGIQAGAVAVLLGAPFTLALEALVVVGAVLGIALRVPQVRRTRV